MDVLSEVLKVVKLQGALFYNGEFSSPWSLYSPPSRTVAPYVAPGARHVIVYHLLTEGRASARLVDGERIILEAGDIVIFPHGDAHFLENGLPAKSVDMEKELARIFSQGISDRLWVVEGKLRNSSVASWPASHDSVKFFLAACRRCSKSAFVTMLRADGWRTRSAFR